MVSGSVCICSSRPAFASIFLTRESWKPLCEIFLPDWEERNMFRITRSNRWKNSFFAQSMCNSWWYSCWPSCLPYPLNHCEIYNPHNEWFCSVSLFVTEFTFWLWNVNVHLHVNISVASPTVSWSNHLFFTVLSVSLLHFLVLGPCGMPFLFDVAFQQHLISLC